MDIREILDKALIELGHQASPFLIAESALVLRAATTCITPVKGAMDAVTTLVDAGYRLCICSNTQRAFTIGELRAFGLLSFFNPIVFSSDVGACKPEMAIFNRIIELTGIANPSDIVHIGDNYIDDIEGAKRVGLRTIWLDRDDSNLPYPLADCRITLSDLPNLIDVIHGL